MRRLLPVLLCLAVAPVTAGCGSDDVKDLAGGDIAKAAERTAAQKTARMTMTMQMSGMGLPGTVELKATGVMDLTKPRGTIALDLPEGLLGENASVELLVDGGDLYAHLPEALTSFSGGKRWVSLDLVAIAKQLGIDVEGLSAAMNPSPSAQLKIFESLKGLKEVGTEKIDGVDTRHFKGTYTLREFARALPADKREAAEKALEQFDALPGEKVLDTKSSTEIWIDGDGVARQMHLDMAGMKVSMKLSDFGADLKLDPPSADETFEVTGDMVSKLLTSGLTS